MSILSYECGISSEPLLGITIGDAFDEIVTQFPDNEALVSRHQQIRLNYTQLKRQVDECAKALLTLGLKKGERIGIWSPNCAEWLIVQVATAKIGAVLVNINPSYRLSELEYALTQSGCAVLVIAEKFKTSDYVKMVYELIPDLANLSNGDSNKKVPELRHVISFGKVSNEGMLSWESLQELSQQTTDEVLAEVQSSLSFDEPINIQYTSGTTGYPKGATLSHHNILNNGHLVTELMNFSDQDRLVIPVPLYHCFGMVMGNLGCLTHGATIIYPSDSFDPQAVLETVQEEKATALYGVPTMFLAELNHPDFSNFDLTSLRTGIMAGALCPAELMKRVNKEMHLSEMEIAYGMTETSPVSTQTRHDAPFDKRVTTVGKVLPHTEVKIIDPESGQVVQRGEPGELCTRGYCVMLGYWNNKEQTLSSIDDSRWMHTGDIAVMDEDGYLTIVGRIKDMIIRGGENIYPKEIEEFLYKHPNINEVQVIGIPSDRYGEQVCAWIQLKEGVELTANAIQEYCQDQIAHFKIPEIIKFVDSFPMTVTGKIRKVEMREITIKEMTN